MILGIAIHGVFSFNGMPIWPAQDINQNPQYGVVAEFIHGFRMQLFFLVSGFFTAMMLLKKGSFAVSMHRTKRILIPLLLSVILLVPLMNNMTKLNEFKENFGKEKSEISSKASIKGSSISTTQAIKELVFDMKKFGMSGIFRGQGIGILKGIILSLIHI